MQKGVRSFLSVCAIVISATVLSIPISGLIGAIGPVQAQETHTLTVGFLQDIDSLNPYVGLNDASYVFYGLVYDTMTVIDNQMNPTPSLARSVNAVPLTDPKMVASGEPYGSVWQYNLTHSATWTDGEPFTARDVVFNIELNAWNYTSMWAYQPYSYFMKWAEYIDDYTVRIHFYDPNTQEPMPSAYAYLISIPMLPKHKLQAMNAQDIGFDWTGYFEDTDMPIVGTGPFMSNPTIGQDWYDRNPITLLRNPNYFWYSDKQYPSDYANKPEWAGLPLDLHFDELKMIFFEESTAIDLALRRGEIDVAAFPPQGLRQIQLDVDSGKLKNVATYSGPKVTQYWTEVSFCMNKAGKNPARLDPIVRRAMSMATDKDYIVSQYYLGYAEPGTTLIPPINENWHYEPTASEKAVMAFDLAAANQLLEDNGYRKPTGSQVRVATVDSPAYKAGLVPQDTPLEFEMLVRREYPEEKNIANFLKDQYEQVGIVINYLVIDEAELSARVYTYSYDTCIWYWSADIDPNYQLFVKSQISWFGWSDNKWTNASYEENYTKTVTTMDPAQRKVYVDNCQRVEYLAADYIILAYVNQTYAWNTETWGGWGDWAADPGRSVDNFWTGNPLYFDLYWITPPPPTIPWALIIGAIAAIAIIAVAVVYMRMRGKKKEGSLADESPLGD